MRQRTVNVDGHKITLRARLRTSAGNPIGHYVRVVDNQGRDVQYHVNTLDWQAAMDSAYTRFVEREIR